MENTFPVFCKETNYNAFINTFTENKEEIKKDSSRSGDILCAVCKNKITNIKDAATVNSKHQHLFVNPDGITYNIRCFKKAPGAQPVTEPVIIYTWFPGYSWRVVQCSECRTHNGWKYESTNDEFFGLIEEKIIFR
jgi:hypothetical protein